ncbi:MAG: amidohydrolase family protein [Thermoanaerobaculia bacterium]|nr:amidohydrolase family protein [Thermoanaerobaculia bacterium]
MQSTDSKRLRIGWHLVWVGLSLALAGCGAGPSTVDSGSVAVRCGQLFDGVDAALRRQVTVVVRDGRIESVGVAGPPRDLPVLDLPDHTCLPGLLDLHTHLTDEPANTADFRIYLERDEGEHLRRARHHAEATLSAGFTTVRDVGTYVSWLDRTLRDEIRAGKTPGPRMQIAGFYLTIPGGGGDLTVPGVPDTEVPVRLRAGVARGPEAFRARAQEAVAGGADVLKVIASGAVLAFGGVPAAPEMTPEEIAAVVAVAHGAGLRVAAHAHGAQSIREAILAGADTIEHASLIDEAGMELARERGVTLVMDVYNGDYIDTEGRRQGWPAEFLRKNLETTELQRQAFNRAHALGVPIAFGSDAAVFPHGDNARQFRIMVERGMSPAEALRAATSVAARAMGWENQVGRLAPGLLGDLIAVPGNPLDDVTVLERVTVVVQGGRVVKRP